MAASAPTYSGNQTGKFEVGGSSTQMSGTLSVTAGQLIILYVGAFYNGTLTVSDTAGNFYNQVAATPPAGTQATPQQSFIYFAIAKTTASITILVQNVGGTNGNTFMVANARAFSNPSNLAYPVNYRTQAVTPVGTATIGPLAFITDKVKNQLLCGIMSSNFGGTATIVGPGGSWSSVLQETNGASFDVVDAEEQTISAFSTASASWGISNIDAFSAMTAGMVSFVGSDGTLDRGQYSQTYVITTNTNTPIITPVPGATVYVQFLGVTVNTAGSASRLRIEDGQGGPVILRAATTTADQIFEQLFMSFDTHNYKGYALTQGNPLNVNTSGTGAAAVEVQVIFEIR